MKTLILASVLIAATSAVAAPGAPAMQTAPAVASPYEAKRKTATEQFDAKDFVGARKTIEAALELAQTPKEKSEAMLRLGKTLDAQNLYAEAREVWQKMLPLVQNSPDDLYLARLLIGTTYYNQEMWQPAADAFVEAINYPGGENKSGLRLPLSTIYVNLKQPDKAREQLALIAADETMEADVRGFAQFNIGKTYLDEGKFEEARQNVEAAAKTPGVSGEILIGVYNTLALIAGKQNRPDDAKQAFTNERSLLMQKADGQFKAKNWKGAIESYQSALKAGVPDPRTELVAHLQLGTAYQSLADNDAAITEFQYIVDTEPIESDPNQPQVLKMMKPLALMGLAKSYIAQKQFEPARAALNRFMDYDDVLSILRRKEAQNLLQSLPPKP